MSEFKRLKLPSISSEPVILVADDDDFFRKPHVKSLQFFGYAVIEARNGNELYSHATQLINWKGNFVIIVDNQMPDLPNSPEGQWTGFEKILTLCNEFPLSNLAKRVLFLSRWELQDMPDHLRERGSQHDLFRQDHWWSLYTPFAILKVRIERILS